MINLPFLQNKYAFELQYDIERFAKGEVQLGAIMQKFRDHLKAVADETVKVMMIREPSTSERRDSPSWSAVIDNKREDQEIASRHFLTGL